MEQAISEHRLAREMSLDQARRALARPIKQVAEDPHREVYWTGGIEAIFEDGKLISWRQR
jgi:hypothetical protein